MDALIDALLEWIATQTDYETADMPHPVVWQLSPEELTREFYTGVAHLMPDDGVDERINALFAPDDGPNGTIYILDAVFVEGADSFDDPQDNPLFREILLHELVHFAQWQSGANANWACPALGEPEAYRLGGVYLRQTYTTDPLPNRAFWGAIYGRC